MARTRATADGLRNFLDSSDDDLFRNQERYGLMIYRTAWLVEILAASAGLFIAWTAALAAYNGFPDKGEFPAMMRAFGGALPFVIIAVIEPTKIYLASGVYHAKAFFWKFVFMVGLLALTFVTFETMYNGLVQQNTNIKSSVDEIRNERTRLEEQIDFKQQRVEAYKQETAAGIREHHKSELEKLRISFATKRESLEAALRARLLPIEQAIAELGNQSAFDREKVTQEISDRRQRLASIDKQYDALIAQFSERRDRLNREKAEDLARNDGLFSGGKRTEIEARYDRKIEQLERRIVDLNVRRREDKNVINSELQSLRQLRGRLLSGDRQSREELQRLESQRVEYTNEHQKQLATTQRQQDEDETKLTQERDKRIEEVSTNQDRIPGLLNDIEAHQDELQELEATYRQEASQLQIVQLTKTACGFFYNWCFGETGQENKKFDVAHFPEEKISTVATIWFSSIAFIAATIGSFLALASFLLRDPKAYQVERSKTFKQLVGNIGEGIRHTGAGLKSLLVRFGEGAFEVLRSLADILRKIGNGLNYILISFGEALKIIARSFRRMTLDMRRYLRAPKIKYEKIEVERVVEKRIEVEVPVEKVVVKEVPKEIVRTEIVYVPLYSVEEGKVQMQPDMVNNLARSNPNEEEEQ